MPVKLVRCYLSIFAIYLLTLISGFAMADQGSPQFCQMDVNHFMESVAPIVEEEVNKHFDAIKEHGGAIEPMGSREVYIQYVLGLLKQSAEEIEEAQMTQGCLNMHESWWLHNCPLPSGNNEEPSDQAPEDEEQLFCPDEEETFVEIEGLGLGALNPFCPQMIRDYLIVRGIEEVLYAQWRACTGSGSPMFLCQAAWEQYQLVYMISLKMEKSLRKIGCIP